MLTRCIKTGCRNKILVLATTLLFLWLLQVYIKLDEGLLHRKSGGQYRQEISFGELSSSADSRYVIWDSVYKAAEDYNSEITLVTQCSTNRLFHLKQLIEFWNGPLSVAVFGPGDEIDEFMSIITRLVECYPLISSWVTFHVVIPLSHPPYDKTLRVKVESLVTCHEILLKAKHFDPDNYNKIIPYPGNLLRNVAVKYARTAYIFVIDIDMLPSKHLHQAVIQSQEILHQPKTALVIPAFEVQITTVIPHDKKMLLKLWLQNEVRPFYKNVCWKCQKYTNYERWKSITEKNIFYQVEWHEPYEPFYIASKRYIRYDERFEQYGYNRISQLCSMHIQGIDFKVFSDGFLIHHGFKEHSGFHSTKDDENERNKIIYRALKKELVFKYVNTNRTC